MTNLNRKLHLQGNIFIGISLLVTLSSLLLPRLSERTEQSILALLILLLGVPHGALDTAFAQRFYKVKGIRGWIIFGTVYLLLSCLVIGLWIIAPLLYLIFFLLISLAHFSGDPGEGTKPLSRLFYGGAILVLPALLHSAEVSRLFGFLIGADAAGWIMRGLIPLAPAWLIGLVAAALYEMRHHRRKGLEFIAVGLIALFTPPLVAFTLFFCAMHSVRHVLRTIDWIEQKLGTILLMILLPMIGVLLAALIGWQLLGDRSFDSHLIQVLFVGLAALTVPHMILIHAQNK